MKKPELIVSFDDKICYVLPGHLLRKAQRALMTHYTGKPQLDSLDQEVSAEHSHAGHMICMGHMQNIKVNIYNDGSVKIC